MCQCLIADCIWCNLCGICNAGWVEALLFCACWIAKPQEIQNAKPDCCVCGEFVGYGGNFFFYGMYCCAPEYVINYSKSLTEKS